jgi:MFS family permease
MRFDHFSLKVAPGGRDVCRPSPQHAPPIPAGGFVTSVAHSTPTDPEADAAERAFRDSEHYKWIALTNTTIGVLMATIDASIVLISLPAIFRGINVNPLTPSNTSYLLWMLMGYMVVTAVLVVSFGRIGDMYGRVKMYNLGFAIFTVGSLAASLTYFSGPGAALYLIGMRIVQGVGGAMIMANSTAILTDAFPRNQRGMALGINTVAGIAGSFIGLVAGGLLASVDWHLIFYVCVPIGLFGTVWAYLKLREVGTKEGGSLDLPGNFLFGFGLIAVLVGITYALQPYGGANMGWRSPLVLGLLFGGVAMLVAFLIVESRIEQPMFDLRLFRIRPFVAGNIASLLSSIGRGGLMFMLIIWLQGIWLPLHGYDFTSTPLWAGIYMLPLTGGFLIAGPASGFLSDRFGARPFATGGMIAAAATFALLMLLPVNFGYGWFALLLLANGLAMGLFAAPNTAGIMNAVPTNRRGVASGMRSTFQNSGMTLSIGLFFTIMVLGLSSSLPAALTHGLMAQGVPASAAAKVASLPPVSILFAAFLGYNPMQSLLGPTLNTLPRSSQVVLTGHSFFSNLISGPFKHGLVIVFTFALIMCLIAAVASWLRGATVNEPAEPAASSDSALNPSPSDALPNGTESVTAASTVTVTATIVTEPAAAGSELD